MLKGVNHKVIEVNHPDSLYFERAVFYLRPDVDDLPTHAALSETERFLHARRLRCGRLFWFLAGAAAAAAVCILWKR